jgi:hypothetical protein
MNAMIRDERAVRRLVDEVLGAAVASPAPGFDDKVLRAVRTAGPERRPSRGRGWRPRRAALAGGLLTLAVVAAAFAWPQSRQAVAESQLVQDLFHGFYPSEVSGSRPGAIAESTASGYTVRVVSAYDDGRLVIVALSVTHAGGTTSPAEKLLPDTVVASDSGGHDLTLSNLNTGFAIMRTADGPGAGTPLHIAIDRIARVVPDGKAVATTRVSGPWSLDLRIHAAQPPTALPTPSGGDLGTVAVTFGSVQASDENLSVRMTMHGHALDVSRTTAALIGPDGQPAVAITNERPHFPVRKGEPPPADRGPVADHAYDASWQLSDRPGTYRLVLQAEDGRRLEREIVVTHGLGAGIPRLAGPPFLAG